MDEVKQICATCRCAKLDETWGEWKCLKKHRCCAFHELIVGCADWEKKESAD